MKTLYVKGRPITEHNVKNGFIETNEYKWVRILPNNPQELILDAVWCHKSEMDKYPIEIGDTVEYSKPVPVPHPGPYALGKVVAFIECINQEQVSETYFAYKV